LKKILLLTLAGFLTLLFYSCGSDEIDEKGSDDRPLVFFDTCIAYDFEIQPLEFEQLPNLSYSLEAFNDTTVPRDWQGVILYERNNRYYYHPVALCQRAYALLGAYHYLKDTVYLNRAEIYVRRLMTEAVILDSAAFYPYHFDYKVHKRNDAYLPAPWFSGMAQGQVLGVLARIYRVTGDSDYLDFAHKTFRSLQSLKGESEPWVSFIDERGCFWIEEYPVDPPSMTLNGFIAAVFGLYDYYRLTESEAAGLMLRDCFNTVKNYIPLYRRPGLPSYYNMRFRHYDAGYHNIHVNQLRHLERMSGDPFFGQWADTLQSDFSPPEE